MNPDFAEARLNLAALSLNNRDYKTAEENFRAVIQAAAEELRGVDRPRRRAARQQEDRGGRVAVQRGPEAGPVERPPATSTSGLLYQDYKDGQKPSLQKAQDYYRQFLSHANGSDLRLAPQGGREAHQGHRRNLRRPRRGGEDAGRGRGDAAQGRRAAEADGRADEEAGGRRRRAAGCERRLREKPTKRPATRAAAADEAAGNGAADRAPPRQPGKDAAGRRAPPRRRGDRRRGRRQGRRQEEARRSRSDGSLALHRRPTRAGSRRARCRKVPAAEPRVSEPCRTSGCLRPKPDSTPES